ncbi:hypothetical protein B0H19DRAFT_1060018 [Mycena capillaripes]|nr:hypothetical protein B0H19DRAFT_1060018 [Mycena capillaripes]
MRLEVRADKMCVGKMFQDDHDGCREKGHGDCRQPHVSWDNSSVHVIPILNLNLPSNANLGLLVLSSQVHRNLRQVKPRVVFINGARNANPTFSDGTDNFLTARLGGRPTNYTLNDSRQIRASGGSYDVVSDLCALNMPHNHAQTIASDPEKQMRRLGIGPSDYLGCAVGPSSQKPDSFTATTIICSPHVVLDPVPRLLFTRRHPLYSLLGTIATFGHASLYPAVQRTTSPKTLFCCMIPACVDKRTVPPNRAANFAENCAAIKFPNLGVTSAAESAQVNFPKRVPVPK